jgi:hypothetical protein
MNNNVVVIIHYIFVSLSVSATTTSAKEISRRFLSAPFRENSNPNPVLHPPRLELLLQVEEGIVPSMNY